MIQGPGETGPDEPQPVNGDGGHSVVILRVQEGRGIPQSPGHLAALQRNTLTCG